MVRRHVVVSGEVQGVFFRDTCRRTAAEHGVSGWVRNRADGTVEAVFEGPPEAVERVVAWSRQGPPAARVEQAEVVEEEPEGLTGFAVLPTG
ncbi:acylphosphatase [Streptacidiphilus griseoplanus]|uniref:acylphosphatase n=1 Tax=Peterkaempfera griseoplana TaxID=66896 RepID=UPI000A8A8B20|nr:acylphosphatase [Peterkaempfera griseoplana]